MSLRRLRAEKKENIAEFHGCSRENSPPFGPQKKHTTKCVRERPFVLIAPLRLSINRTIVTSELAQRHIEMTGTAMGRLAKM